MAMRVKREKPSQPKHKKALAAAISEVSSIPWPFQNVANGEPVRVPKVIPLNEPVISAEVVSISEAHKASVPDTLERTVDGQEDVDDSIAYESWLEAYSLNQSSMVEFPIPIRKGVTYLKDGRIKLRDINKILVCELLPGDTWGNGDQRSDAEYPTRDLYRKRNGLSNYHRNKVRLVVDNDPIYKGPNWSSELSTQKPVKCFESWGRPPTCAQLLAEHWANLARFSNYDVVEKNYHLKDGSTVVIQQQIRDASCWGPTLGESTFSGTQSLLQPTVDVVNQVVEQQEVFEAVNDPSADTLAMAEDSSVDLRQYGTSIEGLELTVYNETLALSRIGKRTKNTSYQLLHSKVSGRSEFTPNDACRLDNWLGRRMVHNSRYIQPEVLNYRLNKQFYPFTHNNRHNQTLTTFKVSEKTKWLSGVKQKYKSFEKIGTYVGARAFSASPPVLRQAPMPSQKLGDAARYHLWWMVVKREGVPSDFEQRVKQFKDNTIKSDPVTESTLRISLNHWRYQAACKRIPEVVVARVEKIMPPSKAANQPVTFAQEVLLNEVKQLRERRLERDFEHLDLTNINLRVEPRIGDEFVGPFKHDPLITTDQMQSVQPVTFRELLSDPTWTPKVLEQMKGSDVMVAKVAKKEEPINGDFSKFGVKFERQNSNVLLLPTSCPSSARPKKEVQEPISLKEFGSMLPKKDFGRQRESFIEKLKRLARTDLVFTVALDVKPE